MHAGLTAVCSHKRRGALAGLLTYQRSATAFRGRQARGRAPAAPRAHLSRCSSLKWNSRAIAVRLGAIRFWSAYSSAAVSVKMATMYTRCTSGMGCAASAGPGGQGFLPSDSRTRVGRRPHAVQAAA